MREQKMKIRYDGPVDDGLEKSLTDACLANGWQKYDVTLDLKNRRDMSFIKREQ